MHAEFFLDTNILLYAAFELGCETVYSEDLNHGQLYAGVRVINPFL